MKFDRYLIAPLKTGLQDNLKSWLIMDDAFEYLQNAYVFRGRARKRVGSQLMGATPLNSRFRMLIGTTDAMTGDLGPVTLAGTLAVGQSFSVGAIIFTVDVLATGPTLTTDLSVSPVTGSINTGSNTFTIAGNGATNLNLPVYWYPSLPVMGIEQYQTGAINNHPTYGFDTSFAYVYVSQGWDRSGSGSTPVWHGNNLNYFWVTNWQSVTGGGPVLFVTNFNATLGAGKPVAGDDPIWSFNGSTWVAQNGQYNSMTPSSTGGFFFLPGGAAPWKGPYVQTCRIIVPFKNRLVLLNTIENNNSGTTGIGTATACVQRARYCFNGSPFAVNAWYERNQSDSSGNVSAGGGYIDAATEEQIISAEFIKDRLIVYFERSTWELAYTGNELAPFIWNKLNTELGSQSTFSTIPFDKQILTIGNSGLHSCNGSNVSRIDDKIPNEIFQFEVTNNAALRTVGIRDYYNELAVWAFVSDLETTDQVFPNQMLVYNYQNDSWALNDDCFTFFGYFEQFPTVTWQSSTPTTWEQYNGTWQSSTIQANERVILGGTPEGFVLILNSEISRNAPSTSITQIVYNGDGTLTLTIINHNLDATPSVYPSDSDFVLIENVVADSSTQLILNGTIFEIQSVTDVNTIVINTQGALLTGAYAGGGTCARVSNVQIKTKRFNPYVDQDTNVYVGRVDFGVQRTADGEITVDYYASSNPLSMVAEGEYSGSIMGDSILETSPYDATLYPFEQVSDLLWHPIYFQSQGQYIQLFLYFSDEQMMNPNIALSDFELEGMVLYTSRTDSRLQ